MHSSLRKLAGSLPTLLVCTSLHTAAASGAIPNIVQLDDTVNAIIAQENRAKKRWWECFLGLCRNPGDRSPNEQYCSIAPNGYSLYTWREQPIIVFFDRQGQITQLNLHQNGNPGAPIWRFPIPAEQQSADTIHIFHSGNEALEFLPDLALGNGESVPIIAHRDDTLPQLQAGETYGLEILTSADIADADEGAYFNLLTFERLSDEIRTRISADIAQIESEFVADQARAANEVFNYFYETFPEIARTEFPEILRDDDSVLLLDSVYQLFTLSPPDQAFHLREIIQICREAQNP